MKVDPETSNRPRLPYPWGKGNADVWRSFRDYRGTPVLEAGNSRIDMLRPEIREYYCNDCVALQQRYGRFVLLSSNFTFVNHFIPNQVCNRAAKSANKMKSDAMKSGIVAHKKALFEKFLALVHEVVNRIVYQVIGNNLKVTLAVEAGQLQLNAMEPVIVFNILQSMRMLMRGMVTLHEKMRARNRDR